MRDTEKWTPTPHQASTSSDSCGTNRGGEGATPPVGARERFALHRHMRAYPRQRPHDDQYVVGISCARPSPFHSLRFRNSSSLRRTYAAPALEPASPPPAPPPPAPPLAPPALTHTDFICPRARYPGEGDACSILCLCASKQRSHSYRRGTGIAPPWPLLRLARDSIARAHRGTSRCCTKLIACTSHSPGQHEFVVRETMA